VALKIEEHVGSLGLKCREHRPPRLFAQARSVGEEQGSGHSVWGLRKKASSKNYSGKKKKNF
jgi:hypothetical protein